MTIVDWRTCAHHEVAPLLAAETSAWRRDLDWDVTEAWRVVEPARRAGQLPGFIVRDRGGRPAGWTAFLLHRTSLQVLAFVAADPDVASILVEGILASPEAARADSAIFCVRGTASPLRRVLAPRGFQVDPYRYLSLDLAALGDPPSPVIRRNASAGSLRVWDDDADGFERLCARAYAGSTEIRAFAPSGSAEEWHDYVGSLLSGPGCGWFRPDLSHVIPDRQTEALVGAVFVTDLGLSTAHVAQIVVDPAHRGAGVATRLLHAAARAAAGRSYVRMTLLVSAANRPAERAYARLGFQERSGFVVATRAQPALSACDAFATGGAARIDG